MPIPFPHHCRLFGNLGSGLVPQEMIVLPQVGDLAESFLAGRAMPHEPAADDRSRSAVATPAMDVDRQLPLNYPVDSVENLVHQVRRRDAAIRDRVTLTLNGHLLRIRQILNQRLVRDERQTV